MSNFKLEQDPNSMDILKYTRTILRVEQCIYWQYVVLLSI